MKIGIMSDSHHDLSAIDDAICLADDVDCWLHAGDSIDDAGYLADVSKKPVYAVPGNIDWFSTKPKEILVEIAGKKIFLTHGHKYNVKWTTKYLYEQASKLGADIIVYSATKFLGGHGTTIAGLVVDSGKFNWKNQKFKNFNEADPGYHNLKYSDLGEAAYAIKLRVRLLRDTGAALSPFNSFLILQGIETLSVRIDRHIENALKVAEFLEKHPKIKKVNYPGLPNSPYKRLQEKYLPKGGGSVFTFDLIGGLEAGKKLIDSVNLFSHLANVADAKSLIIHPASTTHGQLTEKELEECGITSGIIRLSVGLEHIDDILEDLSQALDKV